MRRAEIESVDAGSRLTLETEEAPGYDARWSVRLETPDVVASHGLWSGEEPERLVEFFGDLARNRRDWTGDKALSTMEHDLGLRATHDGKGRVVLWVRLGPHLADVEKTWHVVVPLELEAGGLGRVESQVRAELTIR